MMTKGILGIAAASTTAAIFIGMSIGLVPSVEEMLFEDRRSAIVDAYPSQTASSNIQPGIDGLKPHSAADIEQATKWRTSRPGYEFPPNGRVEVLAAHPFAYVAELRILDQSGNGMRKTVLLSDHASGSPVAMVYIHPNHDVRLSLPPGVYNARLDMGMAWSSEKKAFHSPTMTFTPPPLLIPPEGALVEIPRISTGDE